MSQYILFVRVWQQFLKANNREKNAYGIKYCPYYLPCKNFCHQFKYDYYRFIFVNNLNLAVLVVDNGSPFVKDITLCLDKIGQDYVLKKYYEDFKVSNFEKVILSGRQKYKKEINSVNSKIIKTCFANETPILGICYGAEIIALTFGGSIHKTDQVQGLNRIKITLPSILLKETYCNVYESHSYAISHLPENFVCIASSVSAKHEIFCHSSKRIFGTQFHPEKSGHCGTEVIRNFVSL